METDQPVVGAELLLIPQGTGYEAPQPDSRRMLEPGALTRLARGFTLTFSREAVHEGPGLPSFGNLALRWPTRS